MPINHEKNWALSPHSGEHFNSTNSDDLQPTSNLYSSHSYLPKPHNLIVLGSYRDTITFGRGGSATYKIGRRNRQVSRIHMSISYHNNNFELSILGLNGALVDQVQYNQHDIVPLEHGSLVDVLGDRFIFHLPESDQQQMNRQVSPSPEVVDLQEKEVLSSPVASTQHDTVQKSEGREQSPVEKVESPVVPSAEESSQRMMEEQAKPSPKPISETLAEPLTESVDNNKETEEPSEEINDKVNTVQNTKSQTQTGSDSINNQDQNMNQPLDKIDYAEAIIDVLVFSRTSSMPISDIYSRMLKTNASFAEEPRKVWIDRIQLVLRENPFFGEIKRKGKTADGSPKENLYYYNSQLDPVEWRRATYTQVGRSARKCTLKDKQYFWKIPAKLGRHKSNLASEPKRQKLTKDIDENVDPKEP